MFKQLNNELFNNMAEHESPKQKSPESNPEELIKKLTPISSTKEILRLHECVEKLKQQFGELKNDIDPRLFNNPLPNDSKMTYQFGARAYTTDCYPGYIWRNGHWSKITQDLKFEATPKYLFSYADITGITSQYYTASPFVTLDDSYYPAIINGTRIFIRELKSQCNTGTHYYIKNTGMIAYFPFNQNLVTINSIPYFDPINKERNITYQSLKIEYEDIYNMQNASG